MESGAHDTLLRHSIVVRADALHRWQVGMRSDRNDAVLFIRSFDPLMTR